ncbi:MAG: TlpA family protein disulfide reductase [Bacteroidia bacterium]|nr:TlpA family protein disulfide reductase [Bacteroidia bacterium]
MNLKSIILTVAAFLAFNFANAQDTTKSTQKLPSVALKTMDGKSVNIEDYGKTGKITIISFWATWCGPCIKELDNINVLFDQWQKDYGVELVAVTIDDSRNVLKVKPRVDGNGWPYIILLDENKDLARALNVNNPPQTFLLDAEGNIVYTHTGYTEGTEYELEKEIQKLVKK